MCNAFTRSLALNCVLIYVSNIAVYVLCTFVVVGGEYYWIIIYFDADTYKVTDCTFKPILTKANESCHLLSGFILK